MARSLSIGKKLILIISVIVILSLGAITFLVSFLLAGSTGSIRIDAEDNNFTLSSQAATTAENELNSTRSNVSLLLDMLNLSGSSALLSRQTTSYFFDRNAYIGAVVVPERTSFINDKFFVSHEIESSLVNEFISLHSQDIQRAKEGETFVFNAAPVFNNAVLVYMFPWKEDGKDECVVIFFSSDSLSENFSTGKANQIFMINHQGDLLIHSDFELVKSGANMNKLELLNVMNANNDEHRQVIFTDLDGNECFGAYHKLGFANLAVLSVVEKNKALRPVYDQTIKNIWLSCAVLFISILSIFFFSKTISNPLKKLTAVAKEIGQGNFNTDLFDELTPNKKKPRTDEIGVLMQSTKDEREILNTVSRLTNKGVAKAVARKEIDFNPHLKDITIFFSDIRGFTSISDSFTKRFGLDSGAAIIGFLNDYMSRMVNCITISGGNVDKFEGDAIMACWGVLRDDDLSFEHMPDTDPKKQELALLHFRHMKEDALNSIRCALAMRYSLMLYNKKAVEFTKAHQNEPKAAIKPIIRIGSGINTGRATVGFMGSMDKMEFTSIGDSVNLASRTESSNKLCGTDMLITEATYTLLRYDYIKCKDNNYTIKPHNIENEIIVEEIPVTFDVKGKGKQHFYGVVNMPNFDIEKFFKTTDPEFVVDEYCRRAVGPLGPKTLSDVRTLLGIPTPDFNEVNLNAEESKVKAN